MSNTNFLCKTVKSVTEEEDKLLRKKAKEPVSMCRNCKKCVTPILKGGGGGNIGCNRITNKQNMWINTTLDSGWLSKISEKI